MSVELAWGRPNERTPLDLTDVPIAIGDLPPALEGFRLAVVSDVHYGRLVDDAFVRHLAALVNGQAPDAIVIAGDFIDRSRRQFEGCVDLLRAFRAPAGVFGVLGAALIGSITLIPGFVAFPLAAALLKNGAGYMQIAAFVSTLMMVGVVTLPLEIKTFGKRATLIRNVAAFVFSLLAALVIGVVL